jgi:hypothetical protein
MESELGSTDRVRVIGALTAPPLELLLEMVGRAEMTLDLSEVCEIDSDAVRLLAQLAPQQYKLLACPDGSPHGSRWSGGLGQPRKRSETSPEASDERQSFVAPLTTLRRSRA